MQSCRATNDHERLSLHFELRSMRTFLVLTFLLRPSTCATSNETRFQTLASFLRTCDSLFQMSAEVIARSARLLILLEGISERYFRRTYRSKKTANYQVYRANCRLDIFKLRLYENDTLNGKSYSEVFACFRSAADRPRILNKFYLSVYLYSGMGRLKYTHLQRRVVTRYGYLEKKIFPKYM